MSTRHRAAAAIVGNNLGMTSITGANESIDQQNYMPQPNQRGGVTDSVAGSDRGQFNAPPSRSAEDITITILMKTSNLVVAILDTLLLLGLFLIAVKQQANPCSKAARPFRGCCQLQLTGTIIFMLRNPHQILVNLIYASQSAKGSPRHRGLLNRIHYSCPSASEASDVTRPINVPCSWTTWRAHCTGNRLQAVANLSNVILGRHSARATALAFPSPAC